MALHPDSLTVVSLNKDKSHSNEIFDYGEELLKNNRRYLEIQKDISVEMLALHRGICKYAASWNFNRFYSGCIRLLKHQQKLQTLQELFVDIQQVKLNAVLGLDVTNSLSNQLHKVTNSGMGKTFLTTILQNREDQDRISLVLKPSLTPLVPIQIRTPLPIPVLEKLEVKKLARKNTIFPVSFKPKVRLETFESQEDSSFPEKMSNFRRVRIRHRLESALFKFFQSWGEKASEDSVRRFRYFLSFSFFHILRLRRKVVEANLRLVYPELGDTRRKRIARGCYNWAVRCFLDILRIGIRQGRMGEWTRFQNVEVLDEALSQGRGVLLIGAHLGNWEALCPALSERGYLTSMYVGAQTNPLTDALQNETRRKWGIQTIGKGQGASMQMWDSLRENRVVGMLIDQDERKGGIFVDFFGKPASTNIGAAVFHLIHKSPVLLFNCPYVKGHIEICFQTVEFVPCGERDKDINDLTRIIVSGLELMIRRYPEQYFWMHRRWRFRPPGDTKSPY